MERRGDRHGRAGVLHVSLPRRTLVAISHTLAELTYTRVCSPSMRRLTFLLCRSSEMAHQISKLPARGYPQCSRRVSRTTIFRVRILDTHSNSVGGHFFNLFITRVPVFLS